MLSRVAAVKAPRTHNLCRVTGSSGRRREGRESEPQRPNMSRRVFTSAVLLLLIMMMCCNAGGAQQTIKAAPDPRSLPKTYFVWRDKKSEEKVISLRVPSLVEMDGDVFAVAEAPCKDGSEKVFTGIASELLALSDEESKELDTNKLKTQLLEECLSDEKSACHIAGQDDSKTQTRVLVSRPTTVVKGSDIYMLVGNYRWTLAAGVQGADAGDWGLVLVKGNVSKEVSQRRIFWNDTYAIPWNYNKQHESLARLIGSGGSGVQMGDGTLVFPVEGTKKKENEGAEEDEKTVSLIIYTSDNAASWKLSKGMSDGGCSDPSVVEWEDKQLMMMTACDDGRRRVYESGDKGDSWTEALGTLSRVWGNKRGGKGQAVGSGFITATVGEDKRKVMLLTLPVYSKENVEKGELHLWLTDNTHIVDIGPVSCDDDAAASSLLYKSAGIGDTNKGELIALYEKKKDDGKPSHSLCSVVLTEQLQRVKDVLATWKEADDRVSKLCPSKSAKKDASPDNACSPVKITDGLVGFLSGNLSGSTWRDEYLGVNATVNNKDGATKADNGVTFKGRGAWAEWPVGEQGENKLYHFANYNFTLVATVSIDKVPTSGSVPLMGAKMNDDKNTENPVLLGLSYDKEKKCILVCRGGTNSKDQSVTLEETKHHIVILLRNGTQGSAYVDGQPVLGDAQCDLKNTKDKRISHFYIGGDGGAKGVSEVQDVSVTVTNVLLYNRPLNDDEITALNAKLSIPKAKDTKTMAGDTPPEASKPATLETGTPSSLGGQQQTEQELLRTSENAGSGGLSTSAVSSATTSPAAKESDNQSASGTPPEGHSNVDVDSSSEGGQTVDTETEDTVQGDGTHQPSVGTPATADTNAPTAEIMTHDGAAVTPEVGAHSGENEETVGGTDGQKREDIHAQDGEVKAAALSSSLGNVSQGNNSDAGTVCGSGLLPSLLLLLGLWVFAAL
ncbi:putative trans-sialidase, Group VI [Trypanosoma cruzi]|uniref:Trans-sialidase, putative n=2 Tax=Trypanosoma cruzi TaxID=5693 RepID=Q4DUE6_TRYCC|nr:trans-sialidase, putative [Trypanosoma cruzi]EAN96143.1 trans-sialidase, putative [Trypanosoma cruzi]PWU94373.1 putative trans-sialidase, Group VI [Trypanosoma cruzi]|eukprot:XP_817994.1 trans-sialidase [Trypanosoma cruzi strain CL Brener]